MAIVGASGSRQVDAAQHPRRAGRALGRPRAGRRPRSGQDGRQGADALPAPGDRLRLAADRPQPAAVPHRRRERRAADAAGRRGARASARRARRSCSSWSGWASAATTVRTASPAASSSASPSPWRSPTGRRCCSPTSRRASSTRTPPSEIFDLLRRCNTELGVTIVVVTHDPLVSEQVSRTIAIRDGRTSTETLRRAAVSEAGEHHLMARGVRRARPRRPPAAAARLRRRPGPASAACAWSLEDDHITVWPDRDGDDGVRQVRPMSDSRTASSYAPPGTPSSDGPMVDARGLVREYAMGGGVVRAVGGIDLRVERGALIAVKGRSGSGKTTLLSLIGALERPSAGSVVVDGLTVSDLSESRAGRLPPQAHRLHLPGLRPAADPVGDGERRGAAAPDRGGADAARGADQGAAGPGGPGGSGQPSAARAVGWRAAAGRHRPRAGQRAGAPAGRRADRSAGLADRPRDHGPAAAPGASARA